MVRICVVGAGPSGMAVLYHIRRLMKEDPKANLEVVCYEKQGTWGGLWNYTWRTGLDEHGEYIHNSMYKFLWSNAPKECLELPDYTFQDHYGKGIGSYPPREVLFDYLKGRWEKYNLRTNICFKHVVRSVDFDPKTNKFHVVVKDLSSDVLMPGQEFDFVVNCTGHFSFPNVPDFQGFEDFPGHILHAHDVRNVEEFKDQRLLIIGASYTAEDLAIQTIKYDAKHVICSYRTKPMAFKWCKGVEERPLLMKMEGKKAFFKDGTTAEVDSIILCTGYLHYYPFLAEELRMKGSNDLYKPNLYKGTVWMLGGNGRMLYVGGQNQIYTFTMFDAQARWAVKYMAGDIKMPSRDVALKDMEKWRERFLSLNDCHEKIDFQTDFVMDLAKESDYGSDLDVSQLFHDWENNKQREFLTYRDQRHTSKFSGVTSPPHHTTWMRAMDDSLRCFLDHK